MYLHFKTHLQYNVNLQCTVTEHKGLKWKPKEISSYIQRTAGYVPTLPVPIYAMNWAEMFMYTNIVKTITPM
jgi:hypothetical protein